MLIKPADESIEHLNATGGSISNPMMQAAIWAFFRANLDKTVVKVSFIRVRVRDLRILFEMLAGPEPL